MSNKKIEKLQKVFNNRMEANKKFLKYAKSKDWIIGIEIKRRQSEPCEICDKYIGKHYFKDGDPIMPPYHKNPICLCYATSIIEKDWFI